MLEQQKQVMASLTSRQRATWLKVQKSKKNFTYAKGHFC